MTRTHRSLAGLLAASAITVSLPAVAQSQTRAGPAAAAGDVTTTSDIVVTAERRSQSTQEVPATINVFGEQAINDLRIKEVSDLGRLTPGLTVRVSGSTLDPQFTIRGIGMNNSETNQNPAVTTYLDEIALPSNALLGFQLFDLERIEVLKGPQGTLYGRNTTGGAVNLITRRPSHETSFNARIDAGDLNLLDMELGVGGGITQNLAGRFAASYYRRNGWQTLILGPRVGPGVGTRNGDLDRAAVRGSLLWEPLPNVSVLLVGDYSRSRDQAIAYKHTGNLNKDGTPGFCSYVATGVRDENACASRAIPRTGVGGTPTGGLIYFSDPDTGPRTAYASFIYGNENNVDTGGASLRINADFDAITLTSVTGYRKFKRTSGSDDGSPYLLSDNGRVQNLSVFQQELRFASGNGWGPVSWIAGAYYSRDTNRDFVQFNWADQVAFSAEFTSAYRQVTEAMAAFAQIDWNFADKFTLALGGRLTGEHKSFFYDGFTVGSGPFPNPVRNYNNRINAEKATWRATLKYEPTPDLNFYANVSTGFKGGGFPGTISFSTGQLTPFPPETITAYEGGLKAALLNRTLRVNASVYHYDWNDFQATTQVNVQGIPLTILATAGDARITGVEGEIVWNPVPSLTLRGTANYNDARIKNDRYAGQIPPNTPKWMATGVARWEPASPWGSITPYAQVDATYNSEIYTALANDPTVLEPELFLMGARAGVKLRNGVEIAAWVRNLTDRLYRTQVLGSGSSSLPARSTFGDPRTWGISLGYHF